MLESELIEMVNNILLIRSESNRIEIKSAQNGCPKLRDTLSAFANQVGGGVIVFGIDEDNDYSICGVYNASDLIKKVEGQCQEMTPILRPLFTTASINGQTVQRCRKAQGFLYKVRRCRQADD